MHVTAELAVGRLGPERKQEVGKAPVGETRTGRAVGAVLRAPGGIDHVVLRGADRDGVAERLFLGHFVGIDVTGMQEAEM